MSIARPTTESDDIVPPAGGPPTVPNRTLILVSGAVVLVVAVITWLVAFSSVLGVKQITVHGARTITAADVRAAADIEKGTPLIRLDAHVVQKRIEALPVVASARVKTDFPTTVVITIVERQPVGYLAAPGNYVLIDRTGAQYRSVRSVPPGLPRFVVPKGPGAQAAGEALARVAGALTPAVRRHVASIDAFDPTAISLLLTDQRVVRWGSAERSADKARVLPTLLAQSGTRIDVSDPDLVVVSR